MEKKKQKKPTKTIEPVAVTELFNEVQDLISSKQQKLSRLDVITALQMLLQFETMCALQQAMSDENTQQGVR